MTRTIAIVGADSITGTAVAHQLAGVGCGLLLVDKHREHLETLRQTLLRQHPSAMIEVATCPYESAWEADIIILALCIQAQVAAATVIREVVTGKRIIQLADSPVMSAMNQADADLLQKMLPHSCISRACLADFQQHAAALVAR